MFKVKKEIATETLPTFRVTPEIHKWIKETAKKNNITISGLTRQLIEYAITHAEPPQQEEK